MFLFYPQPLENTICLSYKVDGEKALHSSIFFSKRLQLPITHCRLMVGTIEEGTGISQFSSNLGLKPTLYTKPENWVPFSPFSCPFLTGNFSYHLQGRWLPWFSRCFHKPVSCLSHSYSLLLYIIAHSWDWSFSLVSMLVGGGGISIPLPVAVAFGLWTVSERVSCSFPSESQPLLGTFYLL